MNRVGVPRVKEQVAEERKRKKKIKFKIRTIFERRKERQWIWGRI